MPTHPALLRQILNDDPNPGMIPYEMPDGSSAKPLILGKQLDPSKGDLDPRTKNWWPEAQTLMVMSKLQRRVAREGYLLPILTSICLSLVSTMYGTEYRGGRKARLKYRSSSIIDFGICAGSVRVTGQDRLAYLFPNGDLLLGQDPDDHYWLYFKTLKGEEIILDLGMFTFNMCIIIGVREYIGPMGLDINEYVPAFFLDGKMDANIPVQGRIHTEKRRISFLRNPEVHELVGNLDLLSQRGGANRLSVFMDSISQEETSEQEKDMLCHSFARSYGGFRAVLANQQWKLYPSQPTQAIEQDPDELRNMRKRPDLKRIMREHKKVRKNNQKHPNERVRSD